MMNVRIADLKDFEKIMKIYKYAQDYMIQSGNPTQWGHFYPDKELIRSDIHQNACKVIYDENGIHGVCALTNLISLFSQILVFSLSYTQKYIAVRFCISIGSKIPALI